MGYCHYWEFRYAFSSTPWMVFIHGVKMILDELGVLICGKDGTGRARIDDECVAFNGCRAIDSDHEPFVINQRGIEGDSIKTNGKPYDVVVTAVLILLNEVVRGRVKITSDGNKDDWKAGYELFEMTFGKKPLYDDLPMKGGDKFPKLVTLDSTDVYEWTKEKKNKESIDLHPDEKDLTYWKKAVNFHISNRMNLIRDEGDLKHVIMYLREYGKLLDKFDEEGLGFKDFSEVLDEVVHEIMVKFFGNVKFDVKTVKYEDMTPLLGDKMDIIITVKK